MSHPRCSRLEPPARYDTIRIPVAPARLSPAAAAVHTGAGPGHQGSRCREGRGRPGVDPRRRCAQGPPGPLDRSGTGDRAHRRHQDRSQQPQHVVHRHGVRRALEDRPTAARRSRRYSTSRARTTCAASRSIRRIPTCSGSARGRTTVSAARISATACTSRPTRVRRGSAWASRTSEHIGKIIIDPRNPRRGVCRGTGSAVLGRRRARPVQDHRWRGDVDAQSCSSVRTPASRTSSFDPKNADVIYAAAYPRRRHVGQAIGGSPEGGLHKSIDGGKTWTKLASGLPTGDVGRAGLADRRAHLTDAGVRVHRSQRRAVGPVSIDG